MTCRAHDRAGGQGAVGAGGVRHGALQALARLPPRPGTRPQRAISGLCLRSLDGRPVLRVVVVLQDSFNDLKSPSPLMSYDEASSLSPHLDLVNPAYDYVPPELVDLYITNAGGHQTSYVYRLLDECYDQRDYVL